MLTQTPLLAGASSGASFYYNVNKYKSNSMCLLTGI